MPEIVNEFYNLNDIKINKNKSELLLKKLDKSFNYSNNLMIKFESEYITIKPKCLNKSIKILEAKSEIKKLVKNVKYKRITNKQLQYIFNALIILIIEYYTQVTIFNERECNGITSLFRHNIADNQLQVKGTNFLIQLNDKGLLGKITMLIIKQLQQKLWMDLFENNFYKKLFYKKNYSNWILENIKILKILM
ncbi:hypothetical protein RhiirA4_458609 [Rhizophagus irregularis]|uniref:Uncharacterized protein n=1 Tax=Rhizophagus irregularis TaxID=588596 RepID=A0A2I1GCH5_9GLOM|nr:hypothetical protein RhiirA4_458609 [Rhizophagus irregularis]